MKSATEALPRTNTDWLPRAVVLLLLTFGVLMVYIVPPIQAPDEDSHFTRVIMLSEGQIFSTEQNGQWGQLVPQSLADFVAAHMSLSRNGRPSYGYKRWTIDSYQRSPKEPRVFRSYSAQSASPLVYIPQLAGVWIGKAIYRLMPTRGVKFNWPAALYFARLGNIFAFAIFVGLIINALPRFRSIAAGLSMLPMTVHLAASSSYDTTPILAALGLLTVVTRVCVRGGAPLKHEFVFMILAAFFLGHAKVVYAPLLLVVLAWRRNIALRSFVTLCCALLCAVLIGAYSGAALFGMPADEALTRAVAAQKNYLMSHLTMIPELILTSLSRNADFYFISFLGNLGWLDTNFAFPALALTWALLLLAVLTDALEGPQPLGWVGSAATFWACIFSVSAIMLALYLYWTSHTAGVGAPVVDGVQGRYFLPIAFFAAAMCAGLPEQLSRRIRPLRFYLVEVQVALQSALLGLTIFVVLARFWFP